MPLFLQIFTTLLLLELLNWTLFRPTEKWIVYEALIYEIPALLLVSAILTAGWKIVLLVLPF